MKEIVYTEKLHAPDIPAKVRHDSILKTFDALKPGEVMHLSNDHDPKPLHY